MSRARLTSVLFVIDSEGRKREAIQTRCTTCLKLYMRIARFAKKGTWCSRVCFQTSRLKRENIVCAWCSVEFRAPTHRGTKYCSRKCKEAHMSIEGGGPTPAHYGKGVVKYRARAIRKYGAVCKNCGFNADERMLDVDHIDSNRENSAIENLQVLCVWCHAKKTRKVDINVFPGS